MIHTAEATAVAGELHVRYDHARAVTLIARVLMKAVFAGRPDDVVFWSLVYAHYNGGDLCSEVDKQLDEFVPYILRDPAQAN